jgi:hypothetical protein
VPVNHKRGMQPARRGSPGNGQQPNPRWPVSVAGNIHLLMHEDPKPLQPPLDARDCLDGILHTEQGVVVHAAHGGGQEFINVTQHLMPCHRPVRVRTQTATSRFKVGRVHEDDVCLHTAEFTHIAYVCADVESAAALREVVVQMRCQVWAGLHGVQRRDVCAHDGEGESDDAGARAEIQHRQALRMQRGISRGPGGKQQRIGAESITACGLSNV